MGGDKGERLSGELHESSSDQQRPHAARQESSRARVRGLPVPLYSKGNENMINTMLAGDRLRRHLISLELLVFSQLRHVTRNQTRDRV